MRISENIRWICLLILLLPAGLQAQDSARTDSQPPKPRQVPHSEFLYYEGGYEEFQEFSSFSLRTPYHAILSHLSYLTPDHYHPDSAAMVLNLRNPKSERAMTLARKLKEVIEGKGLFVDPEMLPHDADYVDTVSGRNLYRPFPKLKEVYLVRIQGRWVYSRYTVESIERLHKEVYPLGTVDWVPQWSKERFGGLQLWQWLGIILFMVAGWVIHKLLMAVGSLLIKGLIRWFSKDEIAARFFQNVARPFSFLLISALLIWLLPMLALPSIVNKYLIFILKIFIPAFGVMMAYFLVDVLMAYAQKRAEKTPSELDDNLMPMVRKLLKGTVIVVGFLMILSNLDVNITAVLAGLSIGGIAVALAAQDTVKNLFGSLMIYVDRPFKVGDWIISGDIEGTVEEIGVRSTRIRTFADSLIYIPNGRLADSNINNMGLRVYRRLITNIGIDYETPNELIEVFTEGITEIVMSHPRTRKDETFINLHELGPYSMNIRVIMYFRVNDTLTESNYRQEMLLAILRLAARIGIRIAIPRQIYQLETPEGEGSLGPHVYLSQAEAKKKAVSFVEELKKKFEEEEGPAK